MSTSAKVGDVHRAMALLPGGLFVLTAQHEGKRAGVVVRSVQPCADEPPLLAVSVRRGHWIEPLIRDAHTFAVCRISHADRLLVRKFAETARPRDGDPFDCLGVERLMTMAPVITRSTLALDCEVVRHFDLEADHELYIGHVLAARIGHTHEDHPDELIFKTDVAPAQAQHAGRVEAPMIQVERPKPRGRGRHEQ